MNENKNLFIHIGEWWQTRHISSNSSSNRGHWLPTPGNVLFTLAVVGLLILTQQAWANNTQATVSSIAPSATTINYQGRLAAPDGTPQDGTFGMSFTIWDAAIGGNIIWGPENHTAIPVSDGLFNVGLGGQTSNGIPTTTWNGDRYLEITVNGETLSPRELIRSVPIAETALFAQIANSANTALTVPDGSITQLQAPTLLETSEDDTEIRYGNPVVTTDANGFVSIPLSTPFTNEIITWVAVNGDWGAYNGSNFIVQRGRNTQDNTQLGAKVVDMNGSSLANKTIRIQYIAIGR